MELRIIQMSDGPRLQELGRSFLSGTEMEIEMASWNASWRSESLEHYIPLGWSFLVENPENAQVEGFFLGQPLLFFGGHTQVLWVETVLGKNKEVTHQLAETAYRLAREKHFQRVVWPVQNGLEEQVPADKIRSFSHTHIEVKTVK